MINPLFSLLILIFISPISCQPKTISTKENKLSVINELLLNIENNIKANKQIVLCLNAQKVSYIITKNIKELKKTEPNYDWYEIKKLMDKISNDICNENQK